jgi:hypothetical protein
MKSTTDIRNKLLDMWDKYEKGEVDAMTARVHIGFARATLDTLKVEIAAAHLAAGTGSGAIPMGALPPVTLVGGAKKANSGRPAA